MELRFEQHYAHPVEEVWEALTDPELLADWLMPNDFEPEVGHRCEFRPGPGPGGTAGSVRVTVETLEAPSYMQWRWRDADDDHDSNVTFELQRATDGTLLILRHTGEPGAEPDDRLQHEWPARLAGLETTLATATG